MLYIATIQFDAANDDDAVALIGQWTLTPDLSVSVNAYPTPVSGTTNDGGSFEQQRVPAPAPVEQHEQDDEAKS